METAPETMPRVETFIVRLWWPTEAWGDGVPQLRGVVDVLATGARQPFASADDLVALLRQAAPQSKAVDAARSTATIQS